MNLSLVEFGKWAHINKNIVKKVSVKMPSFWVNYYREREWWNSSLVSVLFVS